MASQKRGDGDGTWLAPTREGLRRLQISAGRRSDGSRDRPVFLGATAEECREQAADYLRRKRSGVQALEGRARLRDYLDGWLENRRARIKTSTYESYRALIDDHIAPAIGDLRLEEIRRTHVDRLLSATVAKGLSARRANMARAVLHAALEDAEADGFVLRNVAAHVSPLPHRPRRGDPLTIVELGALLGAARGTRWYPLYMAAVGLGLRQGEALGLTWGDLRADTVVVQHTLRWERERKTYVLDTPKTEESAAILPLLPKVAAAFAEQRERQLLDRMLAGDGWQRWPWDLVFRTAQGRPLHASTVTHQYQADLERAGVRRRTFHDLRHSTATLLIAAGVPDKLVSTILRHSSIATTMDIYAHVDAGLVRSALASLDGLL